MLDSETIDVVSLMEEIKKRVKERIAKGEFSEEEIKEVSERPLNLLPNLEDLIEEVRELFEQFESHSVQLNNLWPTHKPRPKPGIKGKIIHLFQKALSPITKILLAEQVAFNSELVQSLNTLKVYLARINDLASTLYWRQNWLSNTFEDKHYRLQESLNENQRRLFNLYLKNAKRLKNLRRDLQRFTKTRFLESGKKLILHSETGTHGHANQQQDKALEETIYLSFEDLHRGNREEIMGRQRRYLPYFKQCKNVLDVGCGRGEFLELLEQEGIPAKGIDINPVMVSHCRSQGLNVDESDATSYLSAVEPGHHDGIFCAQVVEHLTWSEIIRLIKLSYEKLPKDGILLMETINPQCLTTFCGAFYLDPTHIKPIHPLTLQFACKAIGFPNVEILYTSHYPEEMKLTEVDFFRRIGDVSDRLIDILNNNVIQLNELLYGPQDYAILATKGESTPQ